MCIRCSKPPAPVKDFGGGISSNGDVLLVTNFYGAACLKDGAWTVLFEYKKMFLEAEAQGLPDAKIVRRFHEDEEAEG